MYLITLHPINNKNNRKKFNNYKHICIEIKLIIEHLC